MYLSNGKVSTTLKNVKPFDEPVIVEESKSPKLQFEIRNHGTESAYGSQLVIISDIPLTKNLPTFCREVEKVLIINSIYENA